MRRALAGEAEPGSLTRRMGLRGAEKRLAVSGLLAGEGWLLKFGRRKDGGLTHAGL